MTDERFSKNWLFLYSLIAVISCGLFLGLFFFVYTVVDPRGQQHLYSQYYENLIYIAGFFTLLLVPVVIRYRTNMQKIAYPVWQLRLKSNVYGLLSYLVLIYIIYLLGRSGHPVKIIELFTAFLAIYLIYTFQNELVLDGYPAWQHLATTLNIGVALGKMALVAIIVWMDYKYLTSLILIVILADALIVFARLRYLGHAAPEAQQASRMILMYYNVAFGARIILGIFIPLVYVGYQYLGGFGGTRAIAVFLVMGELLERYLFVYSAVPRFDEMD